MTWHSWFGRRGHARALAGWAFFLTAAVGQLSCASRRHANSDAQASRRLAPDVPQLLSGALGVLLTNQQDYSARVVLTQAVAHGAITLKGNLFQQEGHILFFPKDSDEVALGKPAGGFRFLWDVRQNSGYIISEALRAYAPVQKLKRFSVAASLVPAELLEPLRIEDQPCRQERIQVRSTSGNQQSFHVWRALELQDLPIRLVSWPETNWVIVQLSEIQAEALTPEFFRLPPTYDRFSSTAAMLRELTRKRPALPYEDTFGTHRRY